jgi:hypothetical protein
LPRELQRRSGRERCQPSLAVDQIEQREEVGLVDPAAVHEHECSFRLAVRRPAAMDEIVERHGAAP